MSVPERPEGALIDLARDRPNAALGDLVAGRGGVLVIAPHPDDETLGCGLAMRAALAAGRDIGVLLLTGGGASHPASRRYPTEALKALRRAEFAAALDALSGGLGATGGRLAARTLDLPDGAVPRSRKGLIEATGTASALAREVDARTVWTTWRDDPHVDHVSASALADLVPSVWSGRPPLRRDYAVWGRFGDAGRSVPPDRVLPFDAPAHRPAKRAAMAAHASQLTPMIEDDPDGFIMPQTLVEHFAAAPEIFLVPEARP